MIVWHPGSTVSLGPVWSDGVETENSFQMQASPKVILRS